MTRRARRPVTADRVRHTTHGRGTVLSWRRGGRVAVVRFDTSALPLSVPTRELVAEAETGDGPEAETGDRPEVGAGVGVGAEVGAETGTRTGAETGTRTGAETGTRTGAETGTKTGTGAGKAAHLTGTYEARVAALTLEAMRLGVVPATSVEAYTVGRTAELALVDQDLAQVAAKGGAVRAFLGDYGVGKTHMLELVQQRALEQNYLTAMVMLDARETPPSHPKRVYRALMRALRYPDRPHEEGAGLEPLLTKAAASPAALDAFAVAAVRQGRPAEAHLDAGLHVYLSAALTYLRTLADEGVVERLRGVPEAHAEAHVERCRELLMDWIEGHPTISNAQIDQALSRLPGQRAKIYSLKDYRPWSRIFGYVLSGLSSLARAVGYAGLVVLIDEAEFYSLLSRDNRYYAAHLFKAWTWAALGPDGALPFDSDELEIGGSGILKSLPGRYGTSPGLYTVFAMTPNEDGLGALGGAVPERDTHTLSALDDADYHALTASVCDFYTSAQRDFDVPARLVKPLSAVLAGLIDAGFVGNARQAMKFIIEFLDVIRFHPARVPEVIAGLQRQVAF